MIFQLLFFDQSLLVIILLVVAFATIYYYLPVIKRFRSSMAFTSFTENTEETVEKSNKSLECHKCGGNMVRDYLVSSRPIYWSSSQFSRSLFLGRDPLAFSMRMRMPSFGAYSSLEAHRCERCRMIYIDNQHNQVL